MALSFANTEASPNLSIMMNADLDVQAILQELGAKRHCPRIVILFASTTGVRLNRFNAIINEIGETLLKDAKICVKDVESYVEKTFGVNEIIHAASFLLLSRLSSLDRYRRAVANFLRDIAEERCDIVFGSLHLTYLLQNSIFTVNPAVIIIIQYFRRYCPSTIIKIVYVFDDLWHTLYRVAKRMEYKLTGTNLVTVSGQMIQDAGPYYIDPISLLMWRAIDVSLLNSFSAQYNVQTYIYAVKHPKETTKRFLYALATCNKCFVHIYISHPISVFRRLQNLTIEMCRKHQAELIEEYVNYYVRTPLLFMPGVCDPIEIIKRQIREICSNIVLYEPTSIDEYVLAPVTIICRTLCSACSYYEKQEQKKTESEVCRMCRECIQRIYREGNAVKTLLEGCKLFNDNIQGLFVPRNTRSLTLGASDNLYLWFHIDKMHRWPVPPDYPKPIKQEDRVIEEDFVRKYLPVCREIVNMPSMIDQRTIEEEAKNIIEQIASIQKVVSREFFWNIMLEYCILSHHDIKPYLASNIARLVKTQIELRDYFYIEQSNAVIVIYPLFYYIDVRSLRIDRENKTIRFNIYAYYTLGGGQESEISRALAYSRPVIYVIVPIPLNTWKDRHECLKHLDFAAAIDPALVQIVKLRKLMDNEEVIIDLKDFPIDLSGIENRLKRIVSELLTSYTPATIWNVARSQGLIPSREGEGVEAALIRRFYDTLQTAFLKIVQDEIEWPFGRMGKGTAVIFYVNDEEFKETLRRYINCSTCSIIL